jgi:hypothetical protein
VRQPALSTQRMRQSDYGVSQDLRDKCAGGFGLTLEMTVHLRIGEVQPQVVELVRQLFP